MQTATNSTQTKQSIISDLVESTQTNILPLHLKKILLKSESDQLETPNHFSSNLTRLLDSCGDCV